MANPNAAVSPQIIEVLSQVKRFTPNERLILAKLLLDSVLVNETEDSADWLSLSLSTFEKDWDNPEDAVYDNWSLLWHCNHS